MIPRILNTKTVSPTCLTNRVRLVRDFLQRRAVSRGTPNILYVELTNRCNLSCIMCPHQLMTREQMDMEKGVFHALLEQIDPCRTELIVLHSDGEPFLHPRVFDMIRAIKAKGVRTAISTNATLLDPEKAREIILSGLDILTISLDGADRDVYESIRVGADFEKVMDNARGFLALKGARAPFTILQMIRMPENEHQADDFLRIWRPFRRVNAYAVVKPMTDWFTPREASLAIGCDRPYFGMVVQSNGRVTPCVHDYDGRAALGAIPRDRIYDLWNGEKMAHLRRTLSRGRRFHELCGDCNATSPLRFDWKAAAGLTCFDMASVNKLLPILGYNRPKQY